MNFIEAIILGIVQGVTEFLPISSSGHLVLLQRFFGIEEGNLFFTQMLHFGTLISIIVVYFQDVKELIYGFITLIRDTIKNRKIGKLTRYQKLCVFIVTGTIPTVIIGFAFKDFFEGLYSNLLPIGFAFLVTGILLWLAEKKTFKVKDISKMTVSDTIFIGIFQGLAIIPGISRSGSTIVGGLFRGFNKSLATKYSFLLAIPVIFGSFLLGIFDVIDSQAQALFSLPLLLGVVISIFVGIITIKFLIKLIQNNKLYYFSYYLWILGIITIISQIV